MAPMFGDFIVDYGIDLLENGDLVEAGAVLSLANGCENFDNTWLYALFHKARIAAILEEFDFMLEFLRRSFRATATLNNISGGNKQFKNVVNHYHEFQRYRCHPRFKQLLAHDFKNKKDKDEFSVTPFY